ncbi:SDR family NAD(P)-dependent oxidoreductase [Legionella sp. CNM-4043-24]|uniref:SDR family NAD(P)-dependent oxidoreductase n=1 Tax=Legionella sp. CNM-4043-24 TaxID=3421646 RepID=UPI00403ADD13
MTSSLKNKIILITGASSGIGEACAKRLAADGARLILTARRLDRLNELADALKKSHGTDCLTRLLDVSDREAVAHTIDGLPADWNAIDALINNAGLALSTDPLQQGRPEQWDTMIDTNLKGLLYVSRQVLPGMLERHSGHVVNIGSVAGQDCYPNGNVYSATKHAVRAITKSMRMDLAGKNIRVTEIAPGAVETEFSKVRWSDEERANAFYQDFNPLLAEDIADAVHYCLTRPPHVDIAEMTIFPTDQAACSMINRSGRS